MEIDQNKWFNEATNLSDSGFSELISMIPSVFRDQAAMLAKFSSSSSRVIALQTISMDHNFRNNPKYGLELAQLGQRICKYFLSNQLSDDDVAIKKGFVEFTRDACKSLVRQSRYSEQINLAQEGISWAAESGFHLDIFTELRFCLVEGLLLNGQLELANKNLAILEQEGRSSVNAPKLRSRLNELLKYEATVMESKKDDSFPSNIQDSDTKLTNGIEQFFKGRFEENVKGLDIPDQMKELSGMFGRFFQLAKKNLGDEWQLRAEIANVINLIADQLKDNYVSYNNSILLEAERRIEKVRESAANQGLNDIYRSTLWVHSQILRKLEKYSEAVDRLKEVRAWLNTERSKVLDPLKRAGYAQEYPLLYPVLIELLYKLKRFPELLEVIEESKGRVITDAVSIQHGHFYEDIKLGNIMSWLPDLTKSEKFHYVTYYLHDDLCYAVIVYRNSSIHAYKLPLNQSDISKIISGEQHTPSNWSPFGLTVPSQLSALVSWLSKLLKKGVINQDDHICYCPDGELHVIPFQYLIVSDHPLIRYFSISRVHSAHSLRCFNSIANGNLEFHKVVCVAVPYGDRDENLESFSEVPNFLQEAMGDKVPVNNLMGVKADINSIVNLDLSNSFVHFTTHGSANFDKSNSDPFSTFGILLSENGSLPTENGNSGLLSPKKILDGFNDRLSNSHISLMACVSGVSHAGIDKDLIGTEWALIFKGATSIVSSHWDVELPDANKFFKVFYSNWLNGSMNKAQALRFACREMIGKNNPFQQSVARHWAAFSLTGDWR